MLQFFTLTGGMGEKAPGGGVGNFGKINLLL